VSLTLHANAQTRRARFQRRGRAFAGSIRSIFVNHVLITFLERERETSTLRARSRELARASVACDSARVCSLARPFPMSVSGAFVQRQVGYQLVREISRACAELSSRPRSLPFIRRRSDEGATKERAPKRPRCCYPLEAEHD